MGGLETHDGISVGMSQNEAVDRIDRALDLILFLIPFRVGCVTIGHM